MQHLYKSILTKILVPLSLMLLLSSCGYGFFCHTETYEYYPYEAVILTLDEIETIERLEPQSLVQPGKLYLHHNYVLINEVKKGIHIFDNSDKSNPKNLGFISIPGNHDLLVKQAGDKTILYADNYMNLASIDISDINNITVLKSVKKVFDNYYTYTADGSVIVDYIQAKEPVKDSYRSCPGSYVVEDVVPTVTPSPSSPTSEGGGASQGGSLARFATIDNYLYTIDKNSIQSFNISNPENPIVFNRVAVAFDIETLFPYKHDDGQRLYVGGERGMYIMDAQNPENLKSLGQINHMRSCDPVVVQDNLAYVTLQGSCFNESNRLEIIDVANPKEPMVLETYALQEPYGLGVDDNYLFVCDGAAGLKVYDKARSPKELTLFKQFDEVKALDIIPYDGHAIVIAKNGFFQYDYSDIDKGKMTLLSSIVIDTVDDMNPPNPNPIPLW